MSPIDDLRSLLNFRMTSKPLKTISTPLASYVSKPQQFCLNIQHSDGDGFAGFEGHSANQEATEVISQCLIAALHPLSRAGQSSVNGTEVFEN